MKRATWFVLVAALVSMQAASQAQRGAVPAQRAAAPDVRVVAVEFSFYERAREGWVRASAPRVNGMIAVRCTVEVAAGADAASWSVGFADGERVLDRMTGPGLLDPATRRTTRTWYGRILAPGTGDVACVADVDGELAEADEGNNRMARALDIPAPQRAAPPAPATRAAPRQRFGSVTPREAAQARGAEPPYDLRFVEAAGIKRAGDPSAFRALPSVDTAAVGEPLAVNCGYRVHMDAPNGETLRIPPWRYTVERDAEPLLSGDGRSELVSVRGATTSVDVIARFTPSQAGTYTVRCRLDTGNAIAETDESNNVAEFPLQVGSRTARPSAPARPAARGQPLLAFARAVGAHDFEMGPKEAAVYKGNLNLRFKWQAPDAAAYEWRWQVSLFPFPASAEAPPPALLSEGPVPVNPERVFYVNLASFPPLGAAAKSGKTGGAAQTAAVVKPSAPAQPASRVLPPKSPTTGVKTEPPGVIDTAVDFHIRIVPMKAGKPAGAPSNTVIAHYLPGADPAQAAASEAISAESARKQKLAEMNQQALVYKIDVLSFEPPTFPSRYGCVIVVKNPYYNKLGHPLMIFKPGEEYCPKKDPATQQKSWDEKAWQVIEGYGHAWNGLAWFYDKAKVYVASLFAEVIVPCSLLKKLDEGAVSTCQDIAKEVAGAAIDVGLTAAGVPPTIPDLEGMSQLAKGEAVEAAVDYTCDLLESKGGQCTPEMRKALAAAYSQGIDQLQKDLEKQANEPHCGDVQGAKEQGYLPLPCFGDYPGTEVKPAPGTVETSPAVKVRVTRIKPDPQFKVECGVNASLVIKNNIEGYGKAEAFLWPSAKSKVAPISGVGSSSVLTLHFGPRQPWHPLGPKGATAEWYQLLSGGTGTLSVVGSGSADAQPPLPAGKVGVGCAKGPGPRTITIPKAFADKTFPWTMK